MAVGLGAAAAPKVTTLLPLPTASLVTTTANRGQQVFATSCAVCHGMHGEGAVGPRLADEWKRKDLKAVIAWVKNPQPPMPRLYPEILSQQDVRAVALYVEGFKHRAGAEKDVS